MVSDLANGGLADRKNKLRLLIWGVASTSPNFRDCTAIKERSQTELYAKTICRAWNLHKLPLSGVKRNLPRPETT